MCSRAFLSIILLSSLTSLLAQNCITTAYFDTTSAVRWIDGDLHDDGTVAAITTITDGFGDIAPMAMAEDGSVQWADRLSATDPAVRLQPKQVLATNDGGMLVFGYRFQGILYTNYFAVKLDAAGNKEWARIYMNDVINANYVYLTDPQIVQRPYGNYVLMLSHRRGCTITELNTDGAPLNAYKFNPFQTLWGENYGYDLLLDPDGSIVVTGAASTTLWVMKTDSAMQPIWNYRYDIGGHFHGKMTRTSAGDYLVAGFVGPSNPTLTKIDGNGSFMWMKQYSEPGLIEDIVELPNGEIVMSNSDGIGPHILHVDAAGQVIGSWNSDVEVNLGVDLIGARGDSIYLGMSTQHFTGTRPQTIIATDLGNLCGVSSQSNSISFSLNSANTTDTLVVLDDSVKTWTMAIGNNADWNELDVAASLAWDPLVVGFSALQVIHVDVHGGQTPGPIEVNYEFDPALSFISATPTPSNVTGNNITWTNFTSSGVLGTSLSIHLQVPPDISLMGDTLKSFVEVAQDSLEVTLLNNVDTLCGPVVASYDPNDKLVEPSAYFDPFNDSLIHYTIRFQNTGTFMATNIMILDTLPEQVSVSSFQPGAASHPYTYDINAQGIIHFYFDNIMLPDSNANEPESHGLVSFTVRPDSDLMIGEWISNSADIYFDFNPSIRTEPAAITYGQVVGIPDPQRPGSLGIYPVPVEELIVVELPDSFSATQLEVLSASGALVKTENIKGRSGAYYLPVRDLESGVYIIRVTNEAGSGATAKFIKR